MNAKERLEAWRLVNEWERSQKRTYPSTEDLLDWVSDMLELAAESSPLQEETIEEKVAQVRARKEAFGVLRS